jgi:outer membrane lipoprotein SlyB
MRCLFNNFAAGIALWVIMAASVPAFAADSTYNNRPSPSYSAQRHAVAKRRHRRAVRKTIKRVGIGAAGGAAAGAAIGGGPGAVVGAVAGAGAGTIYDQHEKDKGK